MFVLNIILPEYVITLNSEKIPYKVIEIFTLVDLLGFSTLRAAVGNFIVQEVEAWDLTMLADDDRNLLISWRKVIRTF